jgi:hypothetical protein
VVLAFAAQSDARPLPPGANIDALTDGFTGVTLADRPELAGEVILELDQPFRNDEEAFEGVFRTVVVREDVSGTLDFYYFAEPPLDVFRVTGFDRREIDVDVRLDFADAPGRPGGGAFRTPDGETIIFSFPNGFTFVQTDATAFESTGSAVVVGASPGQRLTIEGVPVPAPAPIVIPLPPALYAGLAGLALAAHAYLRHRRQPRT